MKAGLLAPPDSDGVLEVGTSDQEFGHGSPSLGVPVPPSLPLGHSGQVAPVLDGFKAGG